jgi:PAS domain S-box-containing protein
VNILPKYGLRSLRFKLALTSTLVEVMLLAILIANSVHIATQALEEQTRYRVSEIIPLLNASLANPLVQRDYASLDEILKQVVRKGGITYLAVSDEDERMVAVAGQRPEHFRARYEASDLNDLSHYGALIHSITLAGETVGQLHMSVDTQFLQQTIDRLRSEGLMIASGEVLLTFVLLMLVGILLTRNLAKLASAARLMSTGDLSIRVTPQSQDEIADTAHAFNNMAERLECSHGLLEKSQQRYQTLMEVSPVGIFNTNSQGECVYVNECYCQITGLTPAQFYGSGWIDSLHPDDRDEVMRRWQRCVETETPYEGEHRIINTDAEVVWLYSRAVKSTAVGGYVGTVTDVTHLKSVEQELAQHRDSLEMLVDERTAALEAAQNKLLRQERLATLGQLMATVSHELRNPLAVISNAVYLLKRKYALQAKKWGDEFEGGDAEKTSSYLEMISQEVTAADQIIADLLTTSRTKEPVLQRLNLNIVLATLMTQKIIPANLHWQYESSPSPFMLRADPVQLIQVLKNLITNAVQSIAVSKVVKGEICLNACLSSNEQGAQYLLRLSDNGAGITAAQQQHIFEPLYTTKAKGNGLGLWISREIMRAHGGDLFFEARQDGKQGAVFVLSLPEKCDIVTQQQ